MVLADQGLHLGKSLAIWELEKYENARGPSPKSIRPQRSTSKLGGHGMRWSDVFCSQETRQGLAVSQLA